jgi:hypothetical protein
MGRNKTFLDLKFSQQPIVGLFVGVF